MCILSFQSIGSGSEKNLERKTGERHSSGGKSPPTRCDLGHRSQAGTPSPPSTGLEAVYETGLHEERINIHVNTLCFG